MSVLKVKNGNSWETAITGGVGVPAGGSTGQILKKNSASNYDLIWGTSTELYSGASEPTDPNVSLWFDTDEPGIAEEAVHVGSSAPTNQSISLWYDTDEQGQSVVTSVNGQSGAITIGTISYGTSTGSISVPSATGTQIGEITLTSGVWVVLFVACFDSNATGVRQVSLSSSKNTTRDDSVTTSGFGSSKETTVQLVQIRSIGSETTIPFYAYQDSGSALTVWPFARAVKIASI